VCITLSCRRRYHSHPHEAVKASQIAMQAMDKAVLALKETIKQPQSISGKESRGPPFAASPSHPAFKDFTPGETYKQRVTLTNVSVMRCALKVQGVAEEHSDVFSVNYTPPGHLSAGMACDVWLTFRPQFSKDIHTRLNILTSAGPMSVPLQCIGKKALVRVSEAVVDFGNSVMLGESQTRTLQLTNAGALQVRTWRQRCTASENEHDLYDVLRTSSQHTTPRCKVRPCGIRCFAVVCILDIY
jgi:hypothetical protein